MAAYKPGFSGLNFRLQMLNYSLQYLQRTKDFVKLIVYRFITDFRIQRQRAQRVSVSVSHPSDLTGVTEHLPPVDNSWSMVT